MKKNQIEVIVVCPDCGTQIKVSVDKSASVTIGDAGLSGKATNRSDRPDGGPRGESQEEYLGG